jgi:hypothetical protein
MTTVDPDAPLFFLCGCPVDWWDNHQCLPSDEEES